MRKFAITVFTIALLGAACSSEDSTDPTNGDSMEIASTLSMTVDGTRIDIAGNGIDSNFNGGNPIGFVIDTRTDINSPPITSLDFFIYDISEEDIMEGTEFTGEEEVEIEYQIINELTEVIADVAISADSSDDAFLKITHVDHQNKVFSGEFNAICHESVLGGRSFNIVGTFENISFERRP